MLSRRVGGVMLNGTLVAPAIPLAVAVSVYPALTCAIERSLNVATPLTAGTTVVPERVPAAGLPTSATVTLSPNPVWMLPQESCAATCTGGVAGAPPMVLPGCTV